MATKSKIIQPNELRPFIHQRQMISAPWAFPEISYYFLCGGYGCGKSNTIVFLIITLSKRYQGEDVTIALCSTTITLLNKTVILELAKLLKKTGSRFDYNQKDNIITIGTVRFLLIATGQPTDIYGPNVNITLCLEGNTKVLTSSGYKKIKKIAPGDIVLTRAGWRKVTAAKCQGVKKTITRGGLTGTPDHKIPVSGLTVDLQDLYNHKIFYCSKRKVEAWEQLEKQWQSAGRSLSTLTESDITDTQTAKTITSAIITRARVIRRYTALYGKKLTDQYRKVLSYIIKTVTLATTLLKTSPAFQRQNTARCTAWRKTSTYNRREKLRSSAMYAAHILKGLQAIGFITPAQADARQSPSGLYSAITELSNTLQRFRDEKAHDTKSFVKTAAQLLRQANTMLVSALNDAETRMHTEGDKPQYRNWPSSDLDVPYAAKSLKAGIKALDFARNAASIFTGGKKKVYDITVQDCHEFLTSRGFVHNCDEIDELPEMKAIEAHKALSERTRITLPDGRKPFIMYFSTVHGYRGLYKVVQELKQSRLPNVLVRGLTKNNTSLDPDYVKRLYAIYDEQERLAYLEGRFVNLQSGRVYADYDEETCKCAPFEITPDMTVYVGQDLNSGFSKGTAIVKKDKTLYIVRGWSFKQLGGAPAIMRSAFPHNEILWFPDCSGKEIIRGYKEEIQENGICCRIGASNPRILDTVFYVNKLFKTGRLKVFDCRETAEVSEAIKTQAYNDMGQPEKGKGENDPDHFTDSVRYCIYRIVRSDMDFMDLKNLSRETVRENGYLNITGTNE